MDTDYLDETHEKPLPMNPDRESPIRLGVLGLDCSHCTSYTELINHPESPHHVPGGKVITAWAGGSPDWELSMGRIDRFREAMEALHGVTILDKPEAVAESVDALMILSVDGRAHRETFSRIASYGLPVFIDKPLTVSSTEARDIAEMAKKHGVRWFSSSVWRRSRAVKQARAALGSEPLKQVILSSRWPLESGIHGWFWYGIHWVEVLYELLGGGCRKVTCVREGVREIIAGFWDGDRTGTLVIDHSWDRDLGGLLLSETRCGVISVMESKEDRYASLLRAMFSFFRGGETPVPNAESIEAICFLEAAYESARKSGEPVELD